ncbi:hypothetical protein [Deinococcus pimensis]|uniref:hypothetical protein n=1 Tax=Deinococcus pimensis TaxID=309888 RepID=UPI00047F16E6|nr:hypothetical protein [Deinococcus pimensis]
MSPRTRLLFLVFALVAVASGFTVFQRYFRDPDLPVVARFAVNFQGVDGVVKLYGEDVWPTVVAQFERPASTDAVYDGRFHTIHARAAVWTRALPHEASHLFDDRTGERDVEAQVPGCRANPRAFSFDPHVELDQVTRPDVLDYFCSKGEVLARFRWLVFTHYCGERALGSFGVPGFPACRVMPRYGELDLAHAERVARTARPLRGGR